mmetsp:Transcript_6813/g.7827  ORF Transcript_6813/g.7827 Transcript_6813/m.7827 type:complete len:95 (-) Transcript_6813:5-289(-)
MLSLAMHHMFIFAVISFCYGFTCRMDIKNEGESLSETRQTRSFERFYKGYRSTVVGLNFITLLRTWTQCLPLDKKSFLQKEKLLMNSKETRTSS